MDQVVELDEAAAKLHTQRQKIEKSKNKLEKMAEKLASQEDIMKQRDCDLKVQVGFSQLTLSVQLQNKTLGMNSITNTASPGSSTKREKIHARCLME